MRTALAVVAAVPALMLIQVSHAAALPSLTVPTFSVDFGAYQVLQAYPGAVLPAAAHVVSSNHTATVIGLDSFGDQLHANAPSGGAYPLWIESTLRFHAADGYRITGIAFSATVHGATTPPSVPDNALIMNPHQWRTGAWGNMSLAPVGAAGALTEQYAQSNFLVPVEVHAELRNTGDLRTFDLRSEIGASATVLSTAYTMPGFDYESKVYGTANAWYSNPTLTVYTAMVPVPEPVTWAMLGAGLVIIGAARRGKRGQ